jgi:hypothetical protein
VPIIKKGAVRKAAPIKRKDPGIEHGFRSGLEDKIADQLRAHNIQVSFETHTIPYVKPEKVHKYTPDFPLPNGIVIESKGRFVTADRQKHLAVKAQHPDIDIRFVFSRSKATISKTSSTTYAMWCEKNGFKYADKLIPEAWIREAVNKASLAALAVLKKATKK